MKSTLKKFTATLLAILTILTMTCSASFALAASGGAIVYTGAGSTYYADPSEAWAALASLDESVAFKLLGDWRADENGSFGEGTGFMDGALYLKDKREGMIIDLNGYDIDRGLEESRENGCIFYMVGCKKVVITSNADILYSRITGGNNKNDGGAIVLRGSDVRVSNIKFENNVTEGKGGAFFIKESKNTCTGLELSKAEIENCVITGNKAETGGGVYIDSTNFIWLYDTTVTKNFAKNDAGVHTEVTGIYSTHIHLGGKVVIADNIAENSGTGLMLDENFIGKVSITYVDERPLSKDSKIVILSKTDDNTLRITADSSEYNEECFEYENDSYEIVKKGSGNDKYLAISKN